MNSQSHKASRSSTETLMNWTGLEGIKAAANRKTVPGEIPEEYEGFGETYFNPLEAEDGVVSLPQSRGGRSVLPTISGGFESLSIEMRDEERYEVIRTLGEGAMGEVVLAYDRDIGREVAMKRIHPHLLDAGLVARFTKEVRALGCLEHPNILPIHDVALDSNGELFFTMKYIKGETLEDILGRLQARDPGTHAMFPLSRRIDIFANILMALDHAHSLGVVHRDVKPENIMISPAGEVLLVDWGVAHLMSGDLEGGLAGTPAYMAPEQAAGGVPDTRSDIYSAFIVLFELLTLESYHGASEDLGEMLEMISQKSPPHAFSAVYSDVYPVPVPAQYRHFLVKGLSNRAEDRYDTARMTLEVLALVRSGNFRVQCPATLIRRTHHSTLGFIEHYPTAVTMIMTVMMLVGLVSAIWMSVA